MPDRDEIVTSIRGAWRIFIWDKDAFEDFNLTFEGFWRSFAVPLALIPLYLGFFSLYYGLATGLSAENPELRDVNFISQNAFMIQKLIGHLLGVATMPLTFALLSQMLGFTGRYVHIVIAMNWGHVVALSFFLLPLVLFKIGLAGVEAASVLITLIFLIILIYQVVIVRFATQLNIFISILILAILGLVDLVVDLLLGIFF